MGSKEENKTETISLQAKDENWKDLYSLSKTFVRSLGATQKEILDILLSMEEVFTNISHYAYPPNKAGPVFVKMEYLGGANEVNIFFEDLGMPFDPTKEENPDTHEHFQKRRIGGLGIYMVKSLMDSVNYDYKENKNRLKISKKLKLGGE